jgi:LmbE family N-acetylglucosaminyl deacetylase
VTSTRLPVWKQLLVVVAHPDDESFGLGAVLSTFVDSGSEVSVLCFTHGEASTLHGVEGELSAIRDLELAAAARELGIVDVVLKDFPDGELEDIDLDAHLREAAIVASRRTPNGILAFDSSGVTQHPDHVRATEVASRLAGEMGIGLLGWTLPRAVVMTLNEEFDSSLIGHTQAEIDIEITVDRTRQCRAVECHPSQLTPGAMLWRRLELQSSQEYLRWLRWP